MKRFNMNGAGDLVPVKNGGWVQHNEHRQEMKKAEARIAEQEAALDRRGDLLEIYKKDNAALESQLAGVKDLWDEKYTGQMHLGGGHSLGDKPSPVMALHFTDAEQMNAILSPSFTCPGCAEKDIQWGAAEKALEHAHECHEGDLADLAVARAALAEKDKQILNLELRTDSPCVDELIPYCPECQGVMDAVGYIPDEETRERRVAFECVACEIVTVGVTRQEWLEG